MAVVNYEYIVPVIQIVEGLKIYRESQESCIKLQKELEKYNIKTRVGCACDTDIWSLYVISVPDMFKGENIRLWL